MGNPNTKNIDHPFGDNIYRQQTSKAANAHGQYTVFPYRINLGLSLKKTAQAMKDIHDIYAPDGHELL